jgi:acyl-CoA reductase-like NAD-dependent aldehyde dehydrogenase
MTTTTDMSETPVESISNIFQELRSSFNSGKTRPLAWRKKQIEQIYKMCDEQKDVFASAANADFHRPLAETLLYDCGVVSFLFFSKISYSYIYIL